MVHHPQRGFSDARGKFTNFNSVELVHVYLRHGRHVEHLNGALGTKTDFLEQFDFKRAQSAIGDNKKIAAAASWIEEFQRAEPLMKCLQGIGAACVAPRLQSLEFGSKLIQERGSMTFMMFFSVV